MKPLEKFSIPWEIYMLITGEKKLATYHELQTIYDTQDLYDLLEVLDVGIYLEDVSRKKAEAESKSNSNKRR
jgi:4-diphosphocytidyl-2C-methyl-D-erythritol kinase